MKQDPDQTSIHELAGTVSHALATKVVVQKDPGILNQVSYTIEKTDKNLTFCGNLKVVQLWLVNLEKMIFWDA